MYSAISMHLVIYVYTVLVLELSNVHAVCDVKLNWHVRLSQ